MKTLSEALSEVKNVVIDSTEERYRVEIQSDGSGGHYTIYMVEGSVDVIKLRKNLEGLGLKKRFVIILCSEEKIKLRSKKNEK